MRHCCPVLTHLWKKPEVLIIVQSSAVFQPCTTRPWRNEGSYPRSSLIKFTLEAAKGVLSPRGFDDPDCAETARVSITSNMNIWLRRVIGSHQWYRAVERSGNSLPHPATGSTRAAFARQRKNRRHWISSGQSLSKVSFMD